MELVFFWFVSGIVGAAILSRDNKAGVGCLLGGFLGPIGWIIALVMRSNEAAELKADRHRELLEAAAAPATVTERREERECPSCAERILRKASLCKHCGSQVSPLEASMDTAS